MVGIGGANNVKHRMTNTPEYRAWEAMKYRCNVETSPAYKWYGARGISVCNEWNASFEAFYSHLGKRPEPHPTEGRYSLEREDVNGNYEPGNVVWATSKKQRANTRNTMFAAGATFKRTGLRGKLVEPT